MPKTFMVKQRRHRLPAATSTPTTTSVSDGEMTSSRRVWSPWIDSVSGHVVQQTGRRSDQLADVTSSRRAMTSFPVNNRQHGRLWSPYLCELLTYCHITIITVMLMKIINGNKSKTQSMWQLTGGRSFIYSLKCPFITVNHIFPDEIHGNLYPRIAIFRENLFLGK